MACSDTILYLWMLEIHFKIEQKIKQKEKIIIRIYKPSTIAFDTSISVLPNGCITVQVYRKATHTDKYLSFNSHHPAQHKRSVVSTLMHRANTIPSNQSLKIQEKARVEESLKPNRYPMRFIENTNQSRSIQHSNKAKPAGIAVITYVQGVSDKIERVLMQNNVKTVFKPINTLKSVFKKPKDRPPEEKITGIVFKVVCKDCNFAYVGGSKRCWPSRSVEHDPARAASKESAIRFHAERTDHDIHPRHARILEKKVNHYGERMFLESLHSQLDKKHRKQKKTIPSCLHSIIKNPWEKQQ